MNYFKFVFESGFFAEGFVEHILDGELGLRKALRDIIVVARVSSTFVRRSRPSSHTARIPQGYDIDCS